MGQIEIKENITRNIDYSPCVKCGSENIDFGDCGYSSFNVAWGRCNDCKNEVKISPCGSDISTEQIVNFWNCENNPSILFDKYQNEIREIQKKIDQLPLIK